MAAVANESFASNPPRSDLSNTHYSNARELVRLCRSVAKATPARAGKRTRGLMAPCRKRNGVVPASMDGFDRDAYAVVEGGPDVATKLLELRWGHIFFTGGGKNGRAVAAAAAKQVTPISLELGGKCPVYVDADCDIEIAGRRTLYGKVQTAGQVCIFRTPVHTPSHAVNRCASRPTMSWCTSRSALRSKRL